MDLFRLARLRGLPGRSVHRRQGRRDAAGNCRDRADSLVAARCADRHLRAAGCHLRDYRHEIVDDDRGDHGRPADRVAALLFLCRQPAQQIGADAAVVPHREGRIDRRARDRQVDVGRSAIARRGSQPRQVAFSGLDEPRAEDAAQRHPRLLRGDVQRGAWADGQPDLPRICTRRARFRAAPARSHQRDPRPVAHRSRPLPAQRGAGDAARMWSRTAAT